MGAVLPLAQVDLGNAAITIGPDDPSRKGYAPLEDVVRVGINPFGEPVQACAQTTGGKE